MIINDTQNLVKFEELSNGEVFLYAKSYYMKIYSNSDDDYYKPNAVHLIDGLAGAFGSDYKVTKIPKATLYINPNEE